MLIKDKEIQLQKLLLDTSNYRFGSNTANNQKEAIEKLIGIKGMPEKIYNLSEHITKNGLNPTDLPIAIIDSDDFYTILEGNRRLLALKFLTNPSSCPNTKIRLKIEQLKSGISFPLPKLVKCIVFHDRKDANTWIQLKHNGENKGIGTVEWDSIAKDAYQERNGKKKSIGRQILEFAKNSDYISKDLKHNLHKLNITNIDRLFNGTPARTALGLTKNQGILESNISSLELSKTIEYMLHLMLSDDFSVSDIYHKTDQEKFIKNRIPEEFMPDLSQKQSKSWRMHDLNGAEKTQDKIKPNTKPKAPRSKPESSNRKYLIDFTLKIPDKRINEIYIELKNKLNVHETPNACSILQRVFLELSTDFFIKHNDISRKDNGKKLISDSSSSLATKIIQTTHYLEKESNLNKQQAANIRKVANNADRLFSINSLNQFVHSYEFQPVPSELNKMMDNWSPYIKAIWSNSCPSAKK